MPAIHVSKPCPGQCDCSNKATHWLHGERVCDRCYSLAKFRPHNCKTRQGQRTDARPTQTNAPKLTPSLKIPMKNWLDFCDRHGIDAWDFNKWHACKI